MAIFIGYGGESRQKPVTLSQSWITLTAAHEYFGQMARAFPFQWHGEHIALRVRAQHLQNGNGG